MSLRHTTLTASRLPIMADGVFGYGYWFSDGVPMADA